MSGFEALKGFQYQVAAAIHYFFESLLQLEDFSLISEPPATPELGTIADIIVEPITGGDRNRRVIQVKRVINNGSAKTVICELINAKLRDDTHAELLFGSYVHEYTLPIVDSFCKLADSITANYPESEAVGNIEDNRIVIRIESTISSHSFDGATLLIPDFFYLHDNEHHIVQHVKGKIGGKQGMIKQRIKTILHNTTGYRKYNFISDLGFDTHATKELMQKPNQFFKDLKIAQLTLDHLIDKIQNHLPGQRLNERLLLMRHLFYQFYEAAANQKPLSKHEVIRGIGKVAKVLNPDLPEQPIIKVTRALDGVVHLEVLPPRELREEGLMDVRKLLEEDSYETT